MKINKIKTFGFKNAVIGMRYPHNSEHLSDTKGDKLGKKDLDLILKLTKAGRDHRKVLRMIHVQASVLMPISWWIQYDTYKIATVANSRSRMHTFGKNFLSKKDFYVSEWTKQMDYILETINISIKLYQKGDTTAWFRALDMLPMSYMQERMIDINYETLITIINSRYNEKLLNEWQYFCNSFLNNCPYLLEIWKASK